MNSCEKQQNYQVADTSRYLVFSITKPILSQGGNRYEKTNLSSDIHGV